MTDGKFYKSVQKFLDSEGLNDVLVYKLAAGKFRRYSHFGPLDYLKHPSIMLANLADLFKVAFGVLQSWWIMASWRPDVVFVKGGYVGLPVGLAAGLLWPRRPIVIHDSDTVPGLTNRVLSRFAKKIATGMPPENYDYDESRVVYTGIPVIKGLRPIGEKRQAELKSQFGFDPAKPLLVVTGGGLGAKRLNDAVLVEQKELSKLASVALVAGHDQYEELPEHAQMPSFKVYDFLTEGFDDLVGAADIVVSRAGATTVTELAALAKPTILVPNAMLPSSHQVKNAEALVKADAVLVLDDDELEAKPQLLAGAVKGLLDDAKRRTELAHGLHGFARPDAARELAEVIIQAAK